VSSNRVYLLGSGFSRAISAGLAPDRRMPTMAELSADVREHVRRVYDREIPGHDTPVASNFEAWLSYLVDSPPWLSQSDQERNKAAFHELSLAVYTILLERQNATVTDTPTPPEWLVKLANRWHNDQATVITFNYDQFVELAWQMQRPPSGGSTGRRGASDLDLYPVPITPLPSRMFDVGGRNRARGTMKLLKLHGSLNWWYTGPDSPPGDPIYSAEIFGHRWDVNGIGPQAAHVFDQLIVDMQPMIVPPAAVKSPYYSNRTLRALWRTAGEALRDADELVTMGFSLPATDLIVGAMLATNFKLTDDITITPVDYGPAIVGRICETFGIEETDKRLVTSYTNLGEDAIPRWVATFAS
jgi:hypothetical protein